MRRLGRDSCLTVVAEPVFEFPGLAATCTRHTKFMLWMAVCGMCTTCTLEPSNRLAGSAPARYLEVGLTSLVQAVSKACHDSL